MKHDTKVLVVLHTIRSSSTSILWILYSGPRSSSASDRVSPAAEATTAPSRWRWRRRLPPAPNWPSRRRRPRLRSPYARARLPTGQKKRRPMWQGTAALFETVSSTYPRIRLRILTSSLMSRRGRNEARQRRILLIKCAYPELHRYSSRLEECCKFTQLCCRLAKEELQLKMLIWKGPKDQSAKERPRELIHHRLDPPTPSGN